MSKEKFRRYLWFIWYRHIKKAKEFGKNISVSPKVVINSPRCVAIGDNTIINDDTWINIEGTKDKIKVKIGTGCSIGRRSVLSAVKLIKIGNDVLFGPNVYVSDHSHAYENIKIPIIKQGIDKISPVIISDGSWLGINVVVLPGVSIGKNCVIGANSVVTRAIPDYCIAVGSPARVLKKYSKKDNKWKLT